MKTFIMLDNVRSGHNVGSIFRTSDCMGVYEIILLGKCPKPPHKEILKTSLGATNSVKWSYFENTEKAINYLKSNNVKIFSLEQYSSSVDIKSVEYKKEQDICFVFGNEIHGISKKILNCSDKIIEIPQFGIKHSFNVSVSCGIVLWDKFLKVSN